MANCSWCSELTSPFVHKTTFDFDWARKYDEEYEEFMQTETLQSMEEGNKQLVFTADNMFSGLSFYLKDGLDHWDDQHFSDFVQAFRNNL